MATKKPRKKISKRRRLVKKLDTIFSLYIRARDKYCYICGTDYRLQCGHVFSRAFYNTRWDEENAFGQCAGCNMKHSWDSVPYFEKYQQEFGKEKFDEVYARTRIIAKFSNDDLENMYNDFKEKYELIKED